MDFMEMAAVMVFSLNIATIGVLFIRMAVSEAVFMSIDGDSLRECDCRRDEFRENNCSENGSFGVSILKRFRENSCCEGG